MTFNLNTCLFTLITLLQLIHTSKGNPIWLKERPVYLDDDRWSQQAEYRNFDDLIGIRQKTDMCGGGLCNEQNAESDQIDLPIKREMFISRGWGAGGMPFNVLYMNPKSEIRKSARSPIIAEPLRSQNNLRYAETPNAPPMNSAPISSPETSVRSGGGGVRRQQQQRGRGGQSGGLLPSRRHYSIIPQLFVSYGWGPIGK